MIMAGAFVALALICIGVLIIGVHHKQQVEKKKEIAELYDKYKPDIKQMFLTPNKNSRSQKTLKKIKGIVIHYTANPGTDAEANRDYFESRKNMPDKLKYKVSSHFVIGLDGQIVQCIPLDEISYASNDRNSDTVSIECCHLHKDGKFDSATYTSLIRLSAWLCVKYDINEDDIIRHYDVTGKLCPKYYVKHKTAWKKLKNDIMDRVSQIKQTSGESKDD